MLDTACTNYYCYYYVLYEGPAYNIRFVVRKTRDRYECLTVHPGTTNRAHARRRHNATQTLAIVENVIAYINVC